MQLLVYNCPDFSFCMKTLPLTMWLMHWLKNYPDLFLWKKQTNNNRQANSWIEISTKKISLFSDYNKLVILSCLFKRLLCDFNTRLEQLNENWWISKISHKCHRAWSIDEVTNNMSCFLMVKQENDFSLLALCLLHFSNFVYWFDYVTSQFRVDLSVFKNWKEKKDIMEKVIVVVPVAWVLMSLAESKSLIMVYIKQALLTSCGSLVFVLELSILCFLCVTETWHYVISTGF